jgi:hypothetical protein
LIDSIISTSLDAAISLDEKIEKLTDSLATFSHICPRSEKSLAIAAVLSQKMFQCSMKSGVA